jgi:hypothetical protein
VGAAFFVAQMLLPMIVVFLLMGPMIFGGGLRIADAEQAALWRGELWFVEQTPNIDWHDLESTTTLLALERARLADLEEAGPAVPLGEIGEKDRPPALLALGDRLWVIGPDEVGYVEGGSFTRVGGARRPAGASRPFAYRGEPAVVTLGSSPALATLRVEGGEAEWSCRDLSLDLPAEAGSLRSLQAVEAGGELVLFAELCFRRPGPTNVPSVPSPHSWNCPRAQATAVRKAMPLSIGSSNDFDLTTRPPAEARSTALAAILSIQSTTVSLGSPPEHRSARNPWRGRRAMSRASSSASHRGCLAL